MKITSLIYCLVGFLLITGYYCSSSRNSSVEKMIARGTPKMVVAPDTLDFGEVPEGTEVTHIYEIENKGTDTLRINNVETSCGCTSSLLNDKIVPPKGKSKLQVTFNTRNRVGPNEKAITVFSNDDSQPNKVLLFRGRVVPRPNTENK